MLKSVLTSVMARSAIVAMLCSLSLSAHAIADNVMRRPINIPAENLATALETLSKQSGTDLVYRPEQVRGYKTHGLVGTFSAEEAVRKLLEGTPLTLSKDSTGALLIAAPLSSTNSAPSGAGSAPQTPSSSPPTGDSLQLAQAPPPQASGNAAISESKPPTVSPQKSEQIEEVIVTAQKRNERLQDVPIPVTAINADVLATNDQPRLQDYYTSIPGLIVSPTPASGANQMITIRGISPAGFGNPTVGITIDDVPYGSSTNLGGGLTVEDIDPGELARVEVLRGPQGTLYGANTLGGLIKFVTLDPSTDAVSGSVQTGMSDVYNASQMGYNARASVSVPLSDTLAVRGSGFVRQDPGFIDNPVLAISGINRDIVDGGRLALLFRPSDILSLKVSALLQSAKGYGLNDINEAVNGYVGPPLGDLQQNYTRGIGPYFKKVQAYTAALTAKIGTAELTSITGYNVNSEQDSFDLTSAIGAIATLPIFHVLGSPLINIQKTEKFTQEIRLAMPIGNRVDWLLGAFYTHENSPGEEYEYAENTTTGGIVGLGLYFAFPSTYTEYATFTDFTFHITDQFDIQVGGRESEIKQSSSSTQIGPFDEPLNGAPSPLIYPEVDVKANAFTYLVTPRYKISPDTMVYARVASGYRTGGTNVTPGAPPQYKPDTTKNYEIGFKSDFFDRTFSVDTSVYYIDWQKIQLSLQNPQNFVIYETNAGTAKSEGLELSVEARPVAGLRVSAWAAWNDAKLTENFPSNSTAIGADGDRLPFSPRFSGNLSLDYRFPLVGKVTGLLGGAVSYVGSQEGSFASIFSVPAARQYYAPYARTDLRAGGEWESWTLNLFANNVADKRAIIGGGLGAFPPYAFNVIQPRTIGASLSKTF